MKTTWPKQPQISALRLVSSIRCFPKARVMDALDEQKITGTLSFDSSVRHRWSRVRLDHDIRNLRGPPPACTARGLVVSRGNEHIKALAAFLRTYPNKVGFLCGVTEKHNFTEKVAGVALATSPLTAKFVNRRY